MYSRIIVETAQITRKEASRQYITGLIKGVGAITLLPFCAPTVIRSLYDASLKEGRENTLYIGGENEQKRDFRNAGGMCAGLVGVYELAGWMVAFEKNPVATASVMALSNAMSLIYEAIRHKKQKASEIQARGTLDTLL